MNTTITTPSHALSTPAHEVADLLRPEQLAIKLGVSRRTLTNWVRDKTVPMIKIGRVCLFDLAKVRAVLEQHERPAVIAAR